MELSHVRYAIREYQAKSSSCCKTTALIASTTNRTRTIGKEWKCFFNLTLEDNRHPCVDANGKYFDKILLYICTDFFSAHDGIQIDLLFWNMDLCTYF